MKICETEVREHWGNKDTCREYGEKTKKYDGTAEFASAAIEAYCRGRCRS